MAKNPILRGMNPDPSICSDGENYYIATSTFEWFPGIKIYQSNDLANWELIARPLKEKQINLIGVPDSAGVWAPCLRYYDEKFWLTYSVMHNINGVYKDLRNYIVTAKSVDCEWSDPVYIGSQGFDPSIFQDTNGKYYILTQNWDYRRMYTHQAFNGILLQEYDPIKQEVFGEVKKIFNGSGQGGTEGPTLLKKDGLYYLTTAEGGSGRHHAVTMARSEKVEGPYKLSPNVTLITSYNSEGILQKSGHGNIIFTKKGDSYLVHLVSRYLPTSDVSMLGRETAIQPLEWKDGWPYISGGRNQPLLEVESLPENKVSNDYYTDFKNELDLGWNSLRYRNNNLRITRKGLEIIGDESLSSTFTQSIITRSCMNFNFRVQTELSFDPKTFREQAGLVLYYNTKNWVFLYVSKDEVSNRKIVNLQIARNGIISEPSTGLYGYLPSAKSIELSFDINDGTAKALYRCGETWSIFGKAFDTSYLSDEGVAGWGFTGTMVGITCVDTNFKNSCALFNKFEVLNEDSI